MTALSLSRFGEAFVGVDRFVGLNGAAAVRVQCGCGYDLAGAFDTFDEGVDVTGVADVVRIQSRMLERIGRTERELPSTVRSKEGRPDQEDPLGRFWTGFGHLQEVLDVRGRCAVIDPLERGVLGTVRFWWVLDVLGTVIGDKRLDVVLRVLAASV